MYTSKGTVRVEFGAGKTLFFVPDHDYSIKHGNKTFAVFVPQSGQPIIREYGRDDRDKEIRISLEGVPRFSYDCTNTKVEIRVELSSTATAAAQAAAAAENAVVAMRIAVVEWETQVAAGTAEAAQAAATVVNRWEEQTKAAERAEEAMKDGASELKLIGITIPAAK